MRQSACLVFNPITVTVAAPIFLSTKTFEKRYENGSYTPFFETPLSFFEVFRRLANEIIAGIAV